MSHNPFPSRSRPLDHGRCLLFVYGELQPGRRTPRSQTQAWPDRVRGELFDLGRYPAARNIGCVETWFCGFVLEIAESELISELDPFEGVPEGLYRRIRTTTEHGFSVWIYEYARPLPSDVRGPIERWPSIV